MSVIKASSQLIKDIENRLRSSKYTSDNKQISFTLVAIPGTEVKLSANDRINAKVMFGHAGRLNWSGTIVKYNPMTGRTELKVGPINNILKTDDNKYIFEGLQINGVINRLRDWLRGLNDVYIFDLDLGSMYVKLDDSLKYSDVNMDALAQLVSELKN